MTTKLLSKNNLFLSIGRWLLLALTFGLTYTQTLLYDGNQNTKFLHGLAHAGLGFLNADWMANTADPLPVFSFLVQVTYTYLTPYAFYVFYFLIFGVYIVSILGIASLVFKMDRSRTVYLLYLALILAVYSERLKIFETKMIGVTSELLHTGVAAQYLLGPEFQTNVFGAFLLLSIYVFLQRKYVWAILWVAVAAIVHPAYLFGAGLLTAAYLLILLWEKIDRKQFSWLSFLSAARQPFWLGLLALILVLPVVWYSQIFMASNAPEAEAKALDIIVNFRIPHHAVPAVWLNTGAYIQLAIMLAGLFVVRKSRLFVVMLLPFLGGLLFTVIQILTHSDSLGLLSPWRVSVFLVPLSTAMIIAWLLSAIYDRFGSQLSRFNLVLGGLALVAILLFVVGGIAVEKGRILRNAQRPTLGVLDFVKNSKTANDVYLIPPDDSKFDEFRLYTGAPVFINYKTHPYKALDVLEWYKRLMMSRKFYSASGSSAVCSALDEISAQNKITGIVWYADRPDPGCAGLQEVFHDKNYVLYSLPATLSATP